MEHFYITWLVLLGKKGFIFTLLKLFMKSTYPLENILHSIVKSLGVQLRGYQVSLFPQFPPQNKRLSVSWQQKNKFMESGREEMWQHVAPKTYALFYFFFLPRLFKVSQPFLQKTHHALNNGFETRHYLEFNVLLFWGTICTIVIGQPGPSV